MANPNDFRPCNVCNAQLHYTEGICPYCPEPACVECGETEDVVGKIDVEGWCGRCTAIGEREDARAYDAERYGSDPCADRPFDGNTGEIISRDQLED